jgi:hypothetical protein
MIHTYCDYFSKYEIEYMKRHPISLCISLSIPVLIIICSILGLVDYNDNYLALILVLLMIFPILVYWGIMEFYVPDPEDPIAVSKYNERNN